MAFSDSFVDTAGVHLEVHNTGWTPVGTTGTALAKISGTSGFLAFVATASSTIYAYLAPDPGSADQSVSFVPAVANFAVGVGLRMSGTSNTDIQGYLFRRTGAAIVLDRRLTNGTISTSIATFGSTVAATDTILAKISGSSISVYQNGTQIGSTITDAVIAAGVPGVYQRSTSTLPTAIGAPFVSDTLSTGVTGTAQSTLSSIGGGASTGAVFVAATASSVLASVAGTGSGGVTVGGVSTAQLKVSGAGSGTLGAIGRVGTATAQLTVSGAGSGTLGAIGRVGTATALLTVSGAGSGTLGAIGRVGTSAAQLTIGGAAGGSIIIGGVSATPIAPAGGAGVAAIRIVAAATGTLQPASGQGVASVSSGSTSPIPLASRLHRALGVRSRVATTIPRLRRAT